MWRKVSGRLYNGSRKVRFVAPGAPAAAALRAIEATGPSQRELMKNDRHTDVWLERACNLTAVGLSVTAAFLLSFDFSIPAGLAPILRQAVLIAIVVKLPIFDWVGFYRGLRRFVSIPDLYLVFLGNLVGSTLFAAVSMFWIGPTIPRSVFLIDMFLCFLATSLVRFSARIHNEAFRRERSGERAQRNCYIWSRRGGSRAGS